MTRHGVFVEERAFRPAFSAQTQPAFRPRVPVPVLGCTCNISVEKCLQPTKIQGMFCDRTFFITTNTWQRRPIFRDVTRASLLVEVLLH